MTMLSTHLTTSSVKATEQQDSPSISYLASICLSVSFNSMLSSSFVWIVDSGASRHICCNANAFISLKKISNSRVTLPNNVSIPVSLSGDVKLSSQLVLKYVLFVLQFNDNLISVSALTDNSPLMITFFPDHFMIQDLNTMKMIGKGDKVKELYLFTTAAETLCLKDNHSIPINIVSVQTWQSRIGHSSFKRLDVLKHVLYFNNLDCSHVTPCYVCPLAKQKRLPFITHNHLSKHPFDLGHCDI